MTRSRHALGAFALFAIAAAGFQGLPVAAQAQQQQRPPAYTLAEYNAYQAAAKESNPQQRVKLLDDFVAKFPSSALLPYVYRTYYTTYDQLKDYPKVIEYADKLLALGDKIDPDTRLEAVWFRQRGFYLSFSEKAPNAADRAKEGLAADQQGLQLLAQWKKPAGMTEENYEKQRTALRILFNYTAGQSQLALKDYKGAVNSFQTALQDSPKDPVTYYLLGFAYLQQTPPDSMDGFWALARAVSLKGPSEPQVRGYLRQQLLIYQQPGCDNLLDDEMNQLIQLAGTTGVRPANFTIPSLADLNAIRQKTNLYSVMTALQAGSDQAKATWLAVCGSQFQDVVGKVIDVKPQPESVILNVNTAATQGGYDQEAMQKATAANMEVKVMDQPEANRLRKDDWVQFTGTLASYDAQPFLLHWDKGRVTRGLPPPHPARKRRHR